MTTLPDSLSKWVKRPPRKDNLEILRACSLGWLHRGELDDQRAVYWEMPNGTVFACSRDGPDHMLVHITKPQKYVLVKVL
jgi:hypothetical protein